MKAAFFCLFLFLALGGLQAQQRIHDLSLEGQVYPTGIIPGLRIAAGFSQRHDLNLRLGLNLIDHRDLGVQDNETGWGFGGSLGYRYYFHPGWTKWFVGPRVDLWRNRIDWMDNETGTIGVTRLLVVQPTAEGGYLWALGKGKWALAATLSFGVEVNAVTDGEPTGQGAILLAGLQLGRRLAN